MFLIYNIWTIYNHLNSGRILAPNMFLNKTDEKVLIFQDFKIVAEML